MSASKDANYGASDQTSTGALAAPAALSVRGADAARFLQAQLSVDVDRCADNEPAAFAWCNPQGRVLASGWLLRRDETYVLMLASGRATEVGQALGRYVLRDKVILEPGTVAVVPCEKNARDSVRLPGSPARYFQLREDPGPVDTAQAVAWQLAGIRAGVCELPAALAGRWLPQMLNLDLIGGVSFTKGCYPGQEIIARTYHLGKVKRRLFRYAVDNGSPSPGAEVSLGSRKVGVVVVSAPAGESSELLAVIELEHASAGLQLAADPQSRLVPLPLPYEIPAA